MNKEKYLKEKLAEYQEFVVDQVNRNPEHFGDLVERSAWLMGHHPLYMNPYEYRDGFYDAVRDKDWQSVNDYLYQEMCYGLIPSADGGSGYDHSFYYHWVVEAYACGSEHILQNLYPYELGFTDNGYPYLVVGSNLLIAKFYNDDEMLQQAFAAADKFAKGRAGKWERTAIQFLLDVLNKDFEAANVDLLNVCKGYNRMNRSMYAIEDICIPAHGLYFIAKSWLTREEFRQIKIPVHKMFLQDYAQWRLDNPNAVLKPYMVYPEEMDIINKIYAMPITKTKLTKMRETEQSKLRTVMDGEKMHQIFVEDLRKK